MRPDEHKKKKNTDYKKKHGIPLHKDTKNSEGKHGKGRDTKDSSPDTGSEDKLEPCLQSLSQEPEQETRKFSQRKVTSNWQRYKDINKAAVKSREEDLSHLLKAQITGPELAGRGVSTVQQRGADFAELLEGTGNSHSQFRFQDEKEWEDDSFNSQALQSVLEVNFQELSESLKLLPLIKRLNLDEKGIITAKEKCTVIQDNIKKPCENVRVADTIGHSMPTGPPSQHKTKPATGPPSQHKTKPATGPPSQHKTNPDSKLDFCVPSMNKEVLQTTSHLTMTPQSNTEIVSNTHIIENGDEELELLLSLDNCASKHQNKQMNSHNKQCNLTENTNIPITHSDGPTPHPAPKQEEDLEDWLDSVLE